MSLPNFIVIGPPRTATTWLFRCLEEHPQVFVPNVKEPRFFDENYDKGLAWYQSLYEIVSESTLMVGDITPGYFIAEDVPNRMVELLGKDLKIYIVIRDPVERAYSHYRMLKRNDVMMGNFQDALMKEIALVENSLYAKQIARFLKVFPRSTMRLLSYKILSEEPERYWEIFQTDLGVECVEVAALDRQVNQGLSDMRMPILNQAVSKLKYRLDSSHLSRNLLWWMRDRGLIGMWHRISSKKNTKQSLSPEIAQDVLKKYFMMDQVALREYGDLMLDDHME